MSTLLLAAEAGTGHAELQFPVLTAMVLLPVITALVVALVPRSQVGVARFLGLAGAVATGCLTVYALLRFEAEEAGFQLVSRQEWIP